MSNNPPDSNCNSANSSRTHAARKLNPEWVDLYAGYYYYTATTGKAGTHPEHGLFANLEMDPPEPTGHSGHWDKKSADDADKWIRDEFERCKADFGHIVDMPEDKVRYRDWKFPNLRSCSSLETETDKALTIAILSYLFLMIRVKYIDSAKKRAEKVRVSRKCGFLLECNLPESRQLSWACPDSAGRTENLTFEAIISNVARDIHSLAVFIEKLDSNASSDFQRALSASDTTESPTLERQLSMLDLVVTLGLGDSCPFGRNFTPLRLFFMFLTNMPTVHDLFGKLKDRDFTEFQHLLERRENTVKKWLELRKSLQTFNPRGKLASYYPSVSWDILILGVQ